MNKLYNKTKGFAINVEILLYVFAFLFVFSYQILSAPSAIKFLFDPDQGVQLSTAQQILNGRHPFIDTAGGVYGPLIFYGSTFGQFVSGNRLIGEISIESGLHS